METTMTSLHLNRNVAATLRRDAQYVGQAAVAVVCIGFASLAVGAAVVDIITIAQ
jgi:hypothetical protein